MFNLKCECKASLGVAMDKWSGKWMVKKFEDERNHKFITPSKRMQLMSNKKMPKAAKDLTEIFRRENLPIGKVSSILGGEHIGFNSRDILIICVMLGIGI